MNDYVTSVIRTVVPSVVALLIAALAGAGIDLDSSALEAVISGLLIGVYYAAARWLEGRWPQAGWLLGSPKAPTYN